MPKAARETDAIGHGKLGPPFAAKTTINGQKAVRIDALPICPHPPAKITLPGSASVFIEGEHAARIDDATTCGLGPDAIVSGSPDVVIGG
jgi:uncharacterized Zn-binding protein involved in type VI secretion